MKLFDIKNSDVPWQKSIIISTLISFIVLWIACSRAQFSSYMPDDYMQYTTVMPIEFFMHQGRFVMGVISWLLNNYGFGMLSPSPIFLPLFLLFTSLCSSIIIFNISDKESPFILSLLLSILVVSHPVFSMMAVYHFVVVCFAFSMLCVSAIVCMNRDYYSCIGLKQSIISTILVVLVCGNYQPSLFVVATYFLFLFLKESKSRRIVHSVKILYPLIAGFLLYILIFKLTKNSFGENNWDTRGGLAQNIPLRAQEVLSFLPSLFFKNWWLIPSWYSSLMSASILLFFITCFLKDKIFTITKVFFFLISITALITPIAVMENWDISPRAMFSISFVYGILLCSLNSGKILLKTKISIILLTVMSGLISSNSYLMMVENDNIKDKWIAQEVTKDVLAEGLSGDDIKIVNRPNKLTVADWAFRGLFLRSTGVDLKIKQPTKQDVRECEIGIKFPEKGYILKKEMETLICL